MTQEPKPRDLVKVDGDSLALVCPYHGAQLDCEYEAQRAPCGCLWAYGEDGLLHAIAQDVVADVAESV